MFRALSLGVVLLQGKLRRTPQNLLHLTTRDNPQRGRARARSEGARWSNLSKERKSAPDLRACRPIPLFPIRLPVGKLGCAHEGSTAFDDVKRTTLSVGTSRALRR